MSDYYRDVVIETFHYIGGNSKHSIRARPLPGQGFSTSMRVECSSSMRKMHAVGTLFKVRAKIKDTTQEPHLYTSWQWPYEVVSPEEADEFIAKKVWRESEAV
ncbi:hypothetical protein [Chromobacterium amazonense]|uniref:Uncharacterized protein n=1 Tax=Chromobacterium amazonense TaxID=1382803 RepID=A0ABU8V3E5_9NEIS|nr:hypothetical protein [Chromobacterium amazonense]MDQ4540748.1 hypothetical protein [Chromobacterium amazonense]